MSGAIDPNLDLVLGLKVLVLGLEEGGFAGDGLVGGSGQLRALGPGDEAQVEVEKALLGSLDLGLEGLDELHEVVVEVEVGDLVLSSIRVDQIPQLGLNHFHHLLMLSTVQSQLSEELQTQMSLQSTGSEWLIYVKRVELLKQWLNLSLEKYQSHRK